MVLENRLPTLERPDLILMDRCGCVWRVGDNFEGFGVVSLFGVTPLESVLAKVIR